MTLYLIDGSNLAFRAHYAFPSLTVAGQEISAVYGVVKILTGMLKNFSPGKAVIAFDIGRSTHRKAIYPEYKAHRNTDEKQKKEREQVYEQIPILTDLLRKLGLVVLAEETSGIEADDCIAYCSSLVPDIYQKAIIVSGDKDLCSLLKNDHVSFFDPMRELIVTRKNFKDKLGVDADQWPDFKALRGDVSDNIPHPPGIGEKTAAKLLAEYGSIEKLLATKHQKVSPHVDVLRLAQKLVALDLHEQFPEDPRWGIIDDALQLPRSVDADLWDILGTLQFESILADWDNFYPLYKAYASCEQSSSI